MDEQLYALIALDIYIMLARGKSLILNIQHLLLFQVKDPDSEDVSVYESWAAADGGNNVVLLLLLAKFFLH